MTEVSPGTDPASRPDHFPRPWPSRGITTLTALWGEAQDRRGRFIPAWRVVHDRLQAEGLGRTGTDLAEVWEHEWLTSLFGHATVSHEDPRQALADLQALAEACVAAQSTGAWVRPAAGEPVFWADCPSAKGVFCRLTPSEARQAEDTPHSTRPRVALPYIEVFVAADRLLDPSLLTPAEDACVRAVRYEMPGPDPEAHQRWRGGLEARASAQIRGAIRWLALPLRVAAPPGMETMGLATLTDAAISFVLEADRRGVGSLSPSSDGTARINLSPVVSILPLTQCAAAGGIKSSSPAGPGTTTEEVEQSATGPAAQRGAEVPKADASLGPSPPGNTKGKTKGKKINERMYKIILAQGDLVAGRSAQQWADALGCTKSSVIETPTWKLVLGVQRVAKGLKNGPKKSRRR